MELPVEVIAQIYKKRWQIELLFKQLKQENKARQKGLTDQYSLFPQWEGAYF
jgi:IS4 transposase